MTRGQEDRYRPGGNLQVEVHCVIRTYVGREAPATVGCSRLV